MLDITTTLDPRFNIAYRFGAVFLAEPYPGGAGRPDLAIALLEKGLRARPDKWEYMQDIGFVHYWYGPRLPARRPTWFASAADVPGAPWWLKSLAATTLAAGRRPAIVARDVGSRSGSRPKSTGCGTTPSAGCTQLDALDQIDALQAHRRSRTRGAPARPPDDWQRARARAASCRGIPVDPAGTPYELDPAAACAVAVVAAVAAARRTGSA